MTRAAASRPRPRACWGSRRARSTTSSKSTASGSSRAAARRRRRPPASPRRGWTTDRRPRVAAPGAIVRAATGVAPRRTVAIAAVATAVGLGVAMGCATAEGARNRKASVGEIQEGHASYYGRMFAGRRTASGERYDPKGMTAAHKTLPFGTRIRVTRPGGPSVVLTVNDRSGCTHGRIVDVSEAAARKLDMTRAGVVRVRLEVLR